MHEVKRVAPRVALVLLLFAFALPAAAAEALWEGTLGRQAIVAQIDVDAATSSGRYFYRRHRLDIPLEIARGDGGELEASEQGDFRAQTHPRWVLSHQPGDRLEGEWLGVDGTRMPLHLHRYPALPPVADPALAAVRDEDPYRYLQLSGLALEPAETQQMGAYRLQWFREPLTGIRLFQVVSGYPDAQRARLNDALHARQWALVGAALDCLASPGSDFTLTTTPRRIDARVLSVSLFSSYYCGGAHPDFADVPLNLDARTGRELKLEDVLWPGPGQPPDFDREPASDGYRDYRERVLAPWLAQRMAALYPGEMQPDGEDGCDYRQPEIWQYVSWHVRDAGLYLSPSFPRVARACEYPDWAVLPWAEVMRHPGPVRLH